MTIFKQSCARFKSNDNFHGGDTPEPRYNMILDIAWIRVGPQMGI